MLSDQIIKVVVLICRLVIFHDLDADASGSKQLSDAVNDAPRFRDFYQAPWFRA
jgi:hypothetical protein